jgi:hypothetical protein
VQFRSRVDLSVREDFLCGDAKADQVVVKPTRLNIEYITRAILLISIELKPPVVYTDSWELLQLTHDNSLAGQMLHNVIVKQRISLLLYLFFHLDINQAFLHLLLGVSHLGFDCFERCDWALVDPDLCFLRCCKVKLVH